jgi:hypothetical protein
LSPSALTGRPVGTVDRLFRTTKAASCAFGSRRFGAEVSSP